MKALTYRKRSYNRGALIEVSSNMALQECAAIWEGRTSRTPPRWRCGAGIARHQSRAQGRLATHAVSGLLIAAYLERVSHTPAWMIERVARIAHDRKGDRSLRESVAQLELEATSVLRGELDTFPLLAALVPEDFIQALKAGSGSTMAPRERAAIVLVEADLGKNVPDNLTGCLEAFLELKWAGLDWLLEAGGADV